MTLATESIGPRAWGISISLVSSRGPNCVPSYTFGVVVVNIHNDVAIHSSRGISLWKLLAFSEGFLDEISSDEN